MLPRLILLVLLGPLGIAAADTVELRSGGRVEGQVKRVEQERAPYAVVQVSENLRIAIPESQISRVAESAELAEYRRLAGEAGENAEKHLELSRWCNANTLPTQRRFHLRRVISLEPDHVEARAALGYVAHDGRWIRFSQLQQMRGMISVNGTYQLPAAVALKESRDANTVKVKQWIREIEKLRIAVLRGGDKARQASASLAAIDDPNAAVAMAKELTRSPLQPRELRSFWLERLEAFANSPALEALVMTGLYDPDSVIQEKALEALQRLSPSTALANYLQLLRSNDNVTVRRAAIALSYFPDPEIAFSLVDALVTQHKRVTPANGRTDVGFGSDGRSGLTTGGKASTVVASIENPPVLALLRTLEPDVDYGYNEARWRYHFASRISGYSGNMRRDE